MRPIDADKIVYVWQYDMDGEEHDGVTLQSIINKMPTVDAVEVIRCKDCKHFKRLIPCVGGRYDGCEFWLDNGNEICVLENDFCSYAERRSDAG